MTFFAILFALVIEQVRPLLADGKVHRLAFAWVRASSQGLDAGQSHHGWLVWCCVVLIPSLLAWGIYAALLSIGSWIGAVLAFVWSVAVLYCTLGFRQFSHHFTAVRQALEDGDTLGAIQLLAAWKQVDVNQVGPDQLTKRLMDHAVIAAHRHVFAVLGWYAVLAAIGLGPAGAVLYRSSAFASRCFTTEIHAPLVETTHEMPRTHFHPSAPKVIYGPATQQAAQSAWHWIDYLPARTTAIAFAVVGSFEEVLDAWRNSGHPTNDELIQTTMAASLGLNETAHTDDLRSLVGLVWRSVVLWLLFLALLSLARMLG